jgi:hypothetical protein
VGALGTVYVPVSGPADPARARVDLLLGEPAGLPGAELRATGALARRRADGTAELHALAASVGTPATTAAALERHPAVLAAVLAPAPGASTAPGTGSTDLIAYVPTDDTGLTPAALREFPNRVLQTEGRVTLIDGLLAAAVLAGLVLNSLARLWWADPAAGYVLVYYALREVKEIFSGEH